MPSSVPPLARIRCSISSIVRKVTHRLREQTPGVRLNCRGRARSFSSSCHGVGRRMSRHQATKQWKGRELIDYLATKGILIRSPSYRCVAEEAPGAYKNVTEVVDVADKAGLSKKVAKLEPMICIKG